MSPRARKYLGWGATVAVLAAVFAMYTRPDFVVDMANQVWACF